MRTEHEMELAIFTLEAESRELKAERDAVAARVKEMQEALEEIQRCDFAARVEGLFEYLSDHEIGSGLRDVVERRLLYMPLIADRVLATPVTDETCKKISAALKGRPITATHRNKLSEAKLGKPGAPLSATHLAKLQAGYAAYRAKLRGES